jgi:hypothetical protein
LGNILIIVVIETPRGENWVKVRKVFKNDSKVFK